MLLYITNFIPILTQPTFDLIGHVCKNILQSSKTCFSEIKSWFENQSERHLSASGKPCITGEVIITALCPRVKPLCYRHLHSHFVTVNADPTKLSSGHELPNYHNKYNGRGQKRPLNEDKV